MYHKITGAGAYGGVPLPFSASAASTIVHVTLVGIDADNGRPS